MPPQRNAVERFWEKVDKTGPGGCWLWTASLYGGGYGQFYVTPHNRVPAHRFAYELLVGPIPEGLTLDHVRARGCRHRHCVNPAHLEPVTSAENVRRSDNQVGVNARKTHCKRGHPLTGDNLAIRQGNRRCRACEAQRARDIRAREKE